MHHPVGLLGSNDLRRHPAGPLGWWWLQRWPRCSRHSGLSFATRRLGRPCCHTTDSSACPAEICRCHHQGAVPAGAATATVLPVPPPPIRHRKRYPSQSSHLSSPTVSTGCRRRHPLSQLTSKSEIPSWALRARTCAEATACAEHN